MRKSILHHIFLTLLLTLGTASCGFTPVYGTGSKIAAGLSDIAVAPPGDDRVSYVFVRELEPRIGRNLNGGKVFEYNIQISEETFESAVNYIRMRGVVYYSIVSVQDNQLLFSGSVDNFVSFTADNDVLSSKRVDAQDLLMAILAEQITTELIGRLSDPSS